MPTRKSRLNQAEQERYLGAAESLRASGIDIQIPTKWRENPHALDVAVAGGVATTIFELPNVGVGYAIQTRMTSRQSRLIVSHYEIMTAWDNHIEPVIFDKDISTCKVGWFQYPRDDVLNFRLNNSMRFDYCGQAIEGTILAMGLQPIPPVYRTGARMPFRLVFTDSLGHLFDVESEFYVDRIAKRKNSTQLRGSGLYEPSPIARNESDRDRENIRICEAQHLQTENPTEDD